MDIKTKLEENISIRLEEAKDLNADERSQAVEETVELVKCLNDIKEQESDTAFKEEERKQQKVKERWQNGIAIAGILIPAVISIIGIHKTFKFDDAGGIISSTLGRGFLNNLVPKNKK